MDAMESGSSEVTDHSSKNYVKVVSEPALLHDGIESETKLKPQVSAPSYFHSLSENEAPPFTIPEEEDSPHILIDVLVTEEDVIRMIAVSQIESKSTFKKYLDNYSGKDTREKKSRKENILAKNNGITNVADYLADKNIVKNFNISEKEFLVNLLLEMIEYSAQRDFNAKKLACVLAIYLSTHLYFKRYFWTAALAVWEYFKETLIRHTIEDSPDGCEVFAPDESYDILTHFHTVYLSNIPLIHILCFGVYRLKFTWPF